MRSNLLIFLTTCCLSLQAQEIDNIVFDKGSIPNSPAFVLLDNAPTVIERPDTPKAFGIQLLQDFEDGLLEDIAVEFTPFWYLRPKELTALKMRGIERQEDGTFKQKPFAPLRFANISAAYVTSQDSITNIAIGARATIIEIKHKDDVQRLIEANARVENILKSIIYLMNEFDTIPGNIELKEGTAEEKALYQKNLTAYINAQKLESAQEIYAALDIKPVFALDAAIGYNARYINNSFESGNSGRFGVWTTAAYAQPIGRGAVPKNYLNAYGFFRYLNENVSTSNFNAFDIGFKAELEFNKFSFGYEYISRSGDIETYRSAGSLAYRLTNDLIITGSFGNNFGDTNDLISLLGIRWGFDILSQKLD